MSGSLARPGGLVATDRRSVISADGSRLAYDVRRAQGDAAEPGRVILVHSIGLAGSVWQWTMGFLGQFDVITVDCRGHGRSDLGTVPLTVELLGQDVATIMDDAGWDSAIAVGASMGGMVAQAFASLHPGRASGLGLIDTTAWYGPEGSERWEKRAREVERDGLESVVPFQVARWFSPTFTKTSARVVDETLRVFLQTPTASFAAACRMMSAADLRNEASALLMPTSVVVGAEDYATPPSMSASLQEALPLSTLQILPGVRHLSFIEAPEQVAIAISALARARLDR
jgi:3-oxoadipate enol-lactonase